LIRMMIVDDETVIRKGILTSIDWAAYGIEIAGEASSGDEAFEKMPDVRPHIILTDIRMIGMDGLELAESIKRDFPATKIIILSGYDDFRYAKQAIQIGVSEYLTKPVGAAELTSVISKLAKEIEESLRKQDEQQLSSQLLHETLPILRSKFITGLVNGEWTDDVTLRQKAEQLKIPLAGPRYQVLLVELDGHTHLKGMLSKELAETEAGLQLILERCLGAHFPAIVCEGGPGYRIVLLNMLPEDRFLVLHSCEEVRSSVHREMKRSVTIGLGQAACYLNSIPASFGQALAALNNKAYLGKDRIIHYQDTKQARAGSKAGGFPEKDKRLMDRIKDMDIGKSRELLEQMFRQFKQEETPFEQVKSICVQSVILAVNKLEQMGVKDSDDPLQVYNPYMEIEKFETVAALEQWMGRLFAEFAVDIENHKLTRYKGIIHEAVLYIKKHYREEIKLEEAAKAVYVTPNYLSRVFKEETEQSFTEFVNKYRVKKAKQYLQQNGIRIYEVASMVGYNDYRYFTHIFKKYTGLTPKKFKKEHTLENHT
jgi:two-component system response regulator YesN